MFGDPSELEVLESITHPHIFDRIVGRVERLDSPVVVEMPILTHGLRGDWRRLVVDSREAAKLARAIERGMSAADARARLQAQPSRAEWLASADLVIPNHRSVDELRDVVAGVLPFL